MRTCHYGEGSPCLQHFTKCGAEVEFVSEVYVMTVVCRDQCQLHLHSHACHLCDEWDILLFHNLSLSRSCKHFSLSHFQSFNYFLSFCEHCCVFLPGVPCLSSVSLFASVDAFCVFKPTDIKVMSNVPTMVTFLSVNSVQWHFIRFPFSVSELSRPAGSIDIA